MFHFQKKLKALLVKRLIAVIEPLQKLQIDRSGLHVLAGRKLISDEYYNDFQHSEKLLNSEIEYCFMEAEYIEQGWSKTIFETAINFWRLSMRQAADLANKQ